MISVDEEKMTVFMVTHDLKEGFKLGTRLLVFDKLRWDPDTPQAYGATITYDLPLDSHRKPPAVLAAETEPPEQDLPPSNEGLSNVS